MMCYNGEGVLDIDNKELMETTMKIKLNISKDLKRDLKQMASEKGMERNDFVCEIINDFVKQKEAVWIEKIDGALAAGRADELSMEDKAKAGMKKTKKKLQQKFPLLGKSKKMKIKMKRKKTKKAASQSVKKILFWLLLVVFCLQERLPLLWSTTDQKITHQPLQHQLQAPKQQRNQKQQRNLWSNSIGQSTLYKS